MVVKLIMASESFHILNGHIFSVKLYTRKDFVDLFNINLP